MTLPPLTWPCPTVPPTGDQAFKYVSHGIHSHSNLNWFCSFMKYWNKGEPNNAGEEDCAEFRVDGWDDAPCTVKKYSICKKSAMSCTKKWCLICLEHLLPKWPCGVTELNPQTPQCMPVPSPVNIKDLIAVVFSFAVLCVYVHACTHVCVCAFTPKVSLRCLLGLYLALLSKGLIFTLSVLANLARLAD